MGLFRFLGIESGIHITEHEPAGRFIPITQITHSDQLEAFLTDMVPLLHVNAEHAKTIRYIMSELGRNVLEHARTKAGAMLAAQYYPKSNTIRIGIADGGLGIRKTITQSHQASTDIEAIRLALTPGITGTTAKEGGTEQNAGAGLFFIKSLATRNKNFFVIYSGSGMYKLLKRDPDENSLFIDPFDDRHSQGNDFPFWQGTAVGIDITLNVTEEFKHVLDLIRDVYGQAIRERKQMKKHPQPKFI
jgi:anti-sigma regulatory factor (Ser/Thr protein kinase)